MSEDYTPMCPTCGSNPASEEERICPYDEDIRGVETICTCCLSCYQDCLDDI